jgi:RimJ/RimL family protein N-acetyltransferase
VADDDAAAAPAILTARLVLTPFTPADRIPFGRLAADARVMRFIGPGVAWSRARADEAVARAVDGFRRHGFGWRSCRLRDTAAFVGLVALQHVGQGTVGLAEDVVEIGWWLDPAYWGRGLATEAGVAARDEAFERVGLDRLVGRYQPRNAASGRIMEKLGMTPLIDTTGRAGESVRVCAIERARWLELTARSTDPA